MVSWTLRPGEILNLHFYDGQYIKTGLAFAQTDA